MTGTKKALESTETSPPSPIEDAELAFALMQVQISINTDFNRLTRGDFDAVARKHLAKQLVEIAEDLLRPPSIVLEQDSRRPKDEQQQRTITSRPSCPVPANLPGH